MVDLAAATNGRAHRAAVPNVGEDYIYFFQRQMIDSCSQAVQHAHRLSARNEKLNQVGADETRAAGDQDLAHRLFPISVEATDSLVAELARVPTSSPEV